MTISERELVRSQIQQKEKEPNHYSHNPGSYCSSCSGYYHHPSSQERFKFYN